MALAHRYDDADVIPLSLAVAGAEHDRARRPDRDRIADVVPFARGARRDLRPVTRWDRVVLVDLDVADDPA